MEDKEILEGLKSRRPDDFIENNYWKIDKEQLKDIILELIAITDDEMLEEVTESLIEHKGWKE